MFRYIVGIDEVGRGSLAGPVTVAAVAATVNLKFRIKPCLPAGRNSELPLKDSKKLSPKQREAWFEFIKKSQKLKVKKQRLYYAIASVSPKIIDRINISNAANLAATKALKRLIKNYELRIKNCAVYLDGGLYLNKNIRVYPLLNKKHPRISASTIIRGDEKVPVIALASIVAKVTRDRLMEKLHKKYSRYGFDGHKGYGTKQHFRMIKRYGLSPIHRKSFNRRML